MKRRIVFTVLAACFIITGFLTMLRDSLAAGTAQGDLPSIPDGAVNVPVLAFHHLAEESESSMTVTPAYFEEILLMLATEGYHTITPGQLTDFVDGIAPLPDSSVMITFDDGYESNAVLAAPLLRQYDMCGVVFVIGISVGKETYKDTGIPITPHFSYAQALDVSDVISLQSHTYDMHHTADLDQDRYRHGVLQRADERPQEYHAAFAADYLQSKHEIEGAVHQPVMAYAYPYGLYTAETESILKELGVRMTFLTTEGENQVIPGDADSLYALNRKTVTPDTRISEILDYLR